MCTEQINLNTIFFPFLYSFIKDSDNLHRKIVTFIKTYTNCHWQQFQVLNRHLEACVTDHDAATTAQDTVRKVTRIMKEKN